MIFEQSLKNYRPMASQLSPFRPLDGADGIHVAHRAGLRCSAITLKDGSLCLFSPVSGLDDAVIESLAGIGDVAFLLAPNHYHNQALAEYDAVFPDALPCAPQGAVRRLEKITGHSFEKTERLAALLPDDTDIVEPAGLKTGEIWIRKRGDGPTLWMVVDAFKGPKDAPALSWSETPELLKTFPKFGIRDRDAYRNWLLAQIARDQPQALVPCHGGLVRTPDLPIRLEALVEDL